MAPPALHRLLYVSLAQIDACGDEPRRILDGATQRNAALEVTGLLCFSGDHFAQVLEGSPPALDELMTSIRADSRHRMLREWRVRPVDDGRWFPGWSLAYVHDERLETVVARWVADPAVEPLADGAATALFAGLDQYQARPR